MDKKSVLRISNRLRLRQERIQNKDSILAKILNYNEQEIYGKKSVENKKIKTGVQHHSLYKIFDDLAVIGLGRGSQFLKNLGIKNFVKIELNEYYRFRGKLNYLSFRMKLSFNSQNKIITPWRNIPNVRTFKLNEKVGKNLILKLFGLESQAYHNEPSTVESEKNWIKITKFPRKDIGVESLKSTIWKEIKTYLEIENWTDMNYEIINGLFSKKYFMLLSLINWKSEWYKEHSIEWLKKLFNDYNTCLTVTKHTVKEQWITNGEKWRVLAIAKPGIRLFLSGLNRAIMFLVNPHLNKHDYHGFMFNRGVCSYWKELLKNEGKLLKSEVILEADLAACFNNIDKPELIKSLQERYNFPELLIKIIYHFITLEIKETKINELPSIEGLIERLINKNFNHQNRGLVQGLPISPILAILAIKNGFDDLKKELNLSKTFRILFYADDISIFCNQIDFEKLGGENWIETLNKKLCLIKHGIQLDKSKSEIVKNGSQIYKNLKLLGLEYNFKTGIIKSITRGRLENKKKKIKARNPMEKEFRFEKTQDVDVQLENFINSKRLLRELPELTQKEILNKNYNLQNYFNTIISYLYKGSEKVEQNFKLSNNVKGSILNKTLNNKNKEVKKEFKKWDIKFHGISSYLQDDLIRILYNKSEIGLIYYANRKNSKIDSLKQFVLKNDSKKYYEIKIIFNKLDSPFYNKAKYIDKNLLKKIKKENEILFQKFE
jgi:hypothetical protein